MAFGSWPDLVRPVEAPQRAVGTGSKRFYVREPARSVITRKHSHFTLNWSVSRRWSGRQEQASGQQIEAGPAEHLALEQLQTINVPFDRSLTPRERDPGLDGGTVRLAPSGETPEGRQGTGGGTSQPWIELSRLAPADEGGEVLCERHGLRQRGRLRGQLVVILRRRPLRWTED
jgi:hypothetical protein